MAAQPTSLREIKAELRTLPRERRREIIQAIRGGRAAADPRDAALTVAWAEYLDRKRQSWPRWLFPRERPRGRALWFWTLHAAWLLASVGIACRYEWKWLPSPWSYLALVWTAYTVVTTPFIFRRMFQAYWNAPLAIAANRP